MLLLLPQLLALGLCLLFLTRLCAQACLSGRAGESASPVGIHAHLRGFKSSSRQAHLSLPSSDNYIGPPIWILRSRRYPSVFGQWLSGPDGRRTLSGKRWNYLEWRYAYSNALAWLRRWCKLLEYIVINFRIIFKILGQCVSYRKLFGLETPFLSCVFLNNDHLIFSFLPEWKHNIYIWRKIF